MSKASILQQPLTLPCGHIIPNRIIKAAMNEGVADRHDNATENIKQFIALGQRVKPVY
jgi:2,4-dienoyl-CoA reductase-like NADH-dependent reductase (Old Yellow Enzyme family)